MLAGLNEDLALPLLLPRPQISRDGPFYESVRGKRVLVTGAGGSIGSELVLQAAGSRPDLLVMADISELNLYEIDSTVRQGAPDQKKHAAILDVRDRVAVEKLMHDFEVDVVLHAAALKHVPLLENDHNLIEAVMTNVVGTANVSLAAVGRGADMVLVSTDKAVYPLSTMGKTKRVAELFTRSLAAHIGTSHLSQVRFGNVIGSSGSVVPLFRRQIAQGGPVTVTHREMTRYMMSIREAVGLVLSSADLQHRSGEGYGLHILDMGGPVKIVDLARQLIMLAGRTPGVDIKIEYTGLRPGEKLHEMLAYEWENMKPTEVPRLRKAAISIGRPKALLDMIAWLIQAARARNTEVVREALDKITSEAVAFKW
ncbi:MAG: SDR family NAD(P)-dependent oxidoreductase [Aquamicrobium sp.]|uniref:SDR family NAD(P)-dependent oxidoreductase n=1 Tax=Aquamicrobium sp. TaxID=1872579 RepID=UPI00349EA7E3|nr:SDR family NAD(P)-dependent oxidoreductase [Aquamicrobium sp.]